jgi:predicted molibdopterin-dependent oxidoreductase YjgC
MTGPTMRPWLQRLPSNTPGATQPTPVAFELDGRAVEGREGDTVLSAVLALGVALRHTEYTGQPRAGFCFMGACQDCWMQTTDGKRLRACSTPLQAGMRLVTQVSMNVIPKDPV